MRLCVIANGFQEDYMIHYLESVAGKIEQIDFIGSAIYPREKIDPEINFYDLKGGGIEGLPFWQKVKRVLLYYKNLIFFFSKKPRKGFIHTQWLRFKILDGIILPAFYRLLGYKNIYTVHDILPHDHDTRFNRFVFRIIYRLNWKLVVHTEYLKTRLCREFSIESSKIKVIRHGVYEVEEKVLLPKPDAKHQLGLSTDEILFLFFGYITQYKGIDLLLESFSKISKGKKIKLIIAGRSYENYRQKLDELQQIYTDDKIQFIIRRIEEHELPVLFGATDLTVIPYREASQSGVLFMSYAFGVPVIVPDIGGFPFDVIDNKTGYIFKTGDAASLQEKLENFIDSKNEELFGRNDIRKFAHDNYSWKKSGEELIKFISAK